ncbi:MAG: hypothetical protein NC118_14640 [Eubacterium sp.]|nr:hypothetical protein [Eubacterium sp.]
MEFDYVVGWYSRKKEKVKPLGGFLDIKAAKEFSNMVDTLLLGDGFFCIETPEGKYINGYEKYSDHKSKWFTPEEVYKKDILIHSSRENRNMRLDEFLLSYDDYKKFKSQDIFSQDVFRPWDRTSISEKLSNNKKVIDSKNVELEQKDVKMQREKQYDNAVR